MHARGIIMTTAILVVAAVLATAWWLQTRRTRK